MSAFDRTDSKVPLALCRHYFSAHFETQRVQVLIGNDSSAERWVHWAVGVLGDGNWEALGAWSVASVGHTVWQGISDDLDNRGVVSIALVCAPELEAAHHLSRTAKVLPPFRRILGTEYVVESTGLARFRTDARHAVRQASGVRAARVALERLLAKSKAERALALSQNWPEVLVQFKPFYALRPGHRELVRAGDEHLELLGRSLERAIGRHGTFQDLAAATSFVGGALARYERRLRDRALFTFERSVNCAATAMAGQYSASLGGRVALAGHSP